MISIRDLRKARGLTQQGLAELVGVSNVSVQGWESGRNDITLKNLRTLAQVLGVSVSDIIDENKKLTLAPAVINDSLAAGVIEIDSTEFAAIARYDAGLSAGHGAIIDPNAEPIGHHLIESQWLHMVTRAAPDHLAVLKVDGDSMEPTLRDGDWILIDRTKNKPNRPGIYALAVDDACWIKRLDLDLVNRKIKVISDNQYYTPQALDEGELTIIGRFVALVFRTK